MDEAPELIQVPRYETAALISQQTFRNAPVAYVATGATFADALTGGVRQPCGPGLSCWSSRTGPLPPPASSRSRDALAAVPVAAVQSAPLLLVRPDHTG